MMKESERKMAESVVPEGVSVIKARGREVVESTIAEGVSIIKMSSSEKKMVQEQKKLRVAAYCRVSKDIEQQESSMETQKETYSRLILEHPDWELVEIYADKGKTGTSLKKRVNFNRMIADAEAGKIDMILVKSISRFSRNTVDMLETVRRLRNLGVGVFFEKEKIDTRSLTSELLLTVFAAFAQEESYSISENMRRGMRQRFKMGIPKISKVYGYDNVERGVLGIHQEEANVVRKIYALYLDGYTTTEIANILNQEGIPSPKKENGTWLANTINGILHNEKYIGDCLMQKSVTTSHLTHAHTSHTEGLVESYYKENHHEAIIDREDFKTVQLILHMRDSGNGVRQYPYYSFLKCPDCGRSMIRIILKGRTNQNAWICPGEGEAVNWVDRNPCHNHIVRAFYIDQAVLEGIRQLKPKGHTKKMKEVIARVQSVTKERGKVELYHLKQLVERIEFPDWESIRIHWKGMKPTVIPMHCTRVVDHPDPVITRNQDGSYQVGSVERKIYDISKIKESLKNNQKLLQTTTVEYPGPDDPFQIPVVRMRKENKNGSTE